MNQTLILATWVAIACLPSAEAGEVAQPQSVAPSVADSPRKISAKHLPNLVQVHSKVISGGLPEGEAAFQELQRLGVETVISVDGAKPDVATAAKYGLRYVHLPHGYDGVPDERVMELAKAVRDIEGTIYVHCHHGKHRSPVAASVACVSAGMTPPAEGLAVLRLAGTSPHYRGLFASARNAKPIEKALLDKFTVEFRETVDVPPLAEAMVAMEHSFERLKTVASAGWRKPAKHPDLEPAHEALLLREQFTELLRADYVQSMPAEFKQMLVDSEKAAIDLETALRQWKPKNPMAEPPESFDRATKRISRNCVVCHQKLRDIPLGEK